MNDDPKKLIEALARYLENQVKESRLRNLPANTVEKSLEALRRFLSGEVNSLDKAFGLIKEEGRPTGSLAEYVHRRIVRYVVIHRMFPEKGKSRGKSWKEIGSGVTDKYGLALDERELRRIVDAYTNDIWTEIVIDELCECDLRLMSVNTTHDLVNKGQNLVIVALVGTNLHIRIFDANGKRVVDKAENELMSGRGLTILKKQLNPLPDESGLSPKQKQKLIRAATSIAGHTQFRRGVASPIKRYPADRLSDRLVEEPDPEEPDKN